MSASTTVVNPLPGVPIVGPAFYAALSRSFAGAAELRRVADHLNSDGFAVLDFPDAQIDAHAEALKEDLECYDWVNWRLHGGVMRSNDARKPVLRQHRLSAASRITTRQD